MDKAKTVECVSQEQDSSVASKAVKATQTAVDGLPFGSGTWRVLGVPGLYVRCRARTKSYMIQRKVGGRLVQRVLGQMTLAQARRAAMREWIRLKPRPAEGALTLAQAWVAYIEERPLAPKTRHLYGYALDHYLADWKDRSLENLGHDRAGVRARYHAIAREHGVATAASVYRTLRAVYNYHRRVNPELPENPCIVVDIPQVKPRDWALGAEELRQWWTAVQRLQPVKRAWWLTALLTGARAGSVSGLRWADIDWEKRTLLFSQAKGNRSYIVPLPERLARILAEYRERDALPSEWVFPSPQQPDGPLRSQVRDDKRGVPSAHHLRHTYRTTLVELGATPDQARLLMGHSLGGDVSRGYITAPLLVESLRPLANAVAARYEEILGWG